jgi:hypothetical protein
MDKILSIILGYVAAKILLIPAFSHSQYFSWTPPHYTLQFLSNANKKPPRERERESERERERERERESEREEEEEERRKKKERKHYYAPLQPFFTPSGPLPPAALTKFGM